MSKNRDKKKKARKERIRKQRSAERTKRHAQRKGMKRIAKKLDFDAHDRLEAEILLTAIGVDINKHTIPEAKRYIHDSRLFADKDENLGKSLDKLFYLANGKTPFGYSERTDVSRILSSVVNGMQRTIKTFDRRSKSLFETRIGRLVSSTDDLGSKISAACDVKRDKIEVILARENKFMPVDGEDDFEIPMDDLFEFSKYRFIEPITNPVKVLEGYRLGVPKDFYSDIVQVVTELNPHVALVFLKEVYDEMVPKLSRPFDRPYSSGLCHFDIPLVSFPESILPDPENYERLKSMAVRLNNTSGGEAAAELFSRLVSSGLSHNETLEALEALEGGAREFKTVNTAVEESGDLDEVIKIFSDKEGYAVTYDLLRSVGIEPGKALHFLRDFGDYQVNGKRFVSLLEGIKSRKEAVKLVAENALYICCGEGTEDILAAVIDVNKGTRVLRHYTALAVSDQPFKQLAMIKYVQHRGSKGIDDFIEHLGRYEDENVGEMLAESDPEMFILDVETAHGLPQAVLTHRLKELDNYDLIAKYNVAPELANVDERILARFDATLGRIRDSQYEPVLLGQLALRKLYLERLIDNNEDLLDELPNEGNPYEILKNRLSPVEVEPIKREVQEPVPYQRVLLIMGDINSQTQDYLQKELGVPVQAISTDAGSDKFSGIREGDLIVYDTTRTSHSSYYRAKNLAVRRKASFIHASRMNKDALLTLIKS